MTLKNQVQKFLQETATPNLEGWAWFNLPSTENYNYIVLVDWQEGYDTEPENPFITDGYGLNVSVRVDTGNYFKCDNPYPICTEHGDVIDGYTLSRADIENNFSDVAEDVMAMYEQAKACEDITARFIN